MLRQSHLRGFKIPGLKADSEEQERLIATLFADDTTTYLSEFDSFGDLEEILDTWCKASRARFNISKTETIPVGSRNYRKRLLESRELTPGGPKIPANIRIAEEGRAIRILGGWVGNQTNGAAPWTKILDEIDTSLKRWERTRPTMEGRKLIISMVVGGKTQYLARVQGMPEEIERRLERRINQFLWGEKTPTVNAETTMAPILRGGKGVLDIKSRNEAIIVMWLKSYLNLGDDRATWTYFADAVIAKHESSKTNLDDDLKINLFLQTWSATRLPYHLDQMMKKAKEYGVRLEGIVFSNSVQREMPLWLH
ncbi:hypothetical protein C8J56DRAFT_802567, partial [Mycena floridula]